MSENEWVGFGSIPSDNYPSGSWEPVRYRQGWSFSGKVVVKVVGTMALLRAKPDEKEEKARIEGTLDFEEL